MSLPETGYDFAPDLPRTGKSSIVDGMARTACAFALCAGGPGRTVRRQRRSRSVARRSTKLQPDESQVVELVAAAYVRLRAGMRRTLFQSFIERLRQAGNAAQLCDRALRADFGGLFSEVLLQPEAAIKLLRQSIEAATRPEASVPEELCTAPALFCRKNCFESVAIWKPGPKSMSCCRTVQPDGTPKVTPSVLCRYSDYQGRILESLGDMTGRSKRI